MNEKTVQIVYNPKGGCTISYFLGEQEIGEPKHFDETPKRLEFFLEKFPKDVKAQSSKESKS